MSWITSIVDRDNIKPLMAMACLTGLTGLAMAMGQNGVTYGIAIGILGSYATIKRDKTD